MTKNGRDRYILLDMREYEKEQAVISITTISLDSVKRQFQKNNRGMELI